MHLVRVDNHNSAMSLETTFPIHRKYCFLEAHGQGRVVGLLIQRPFEPPRVIVTHLDYPGVRMESEVPRTYTGGPAVSDLPSFRTLDIPYTTWFPRVFYGISAFRPKA